VLPAAFVRLDALPLTPNGKLDRKALPAPDGASYARETYEPPQGPLEQTLAALWEDLLGVTRINRHDNFFELGGHSLLAMQLVARMPLHFEAELALVDVFSTASLADLGSIIAARTAPDVALCAMADQESGYIEI
jgi:hypothetical protein